MSRPARVHFDPLGNGVTLCGFVGAGMVPPADPRDPLTLPAAVSCRVCQRRHEIAAAEVRRARDEAAAAVRPDVHPEIIDAMAAPGYGWQTLHDRRVLARSIAGEDLSDAPRWGSWRSALAALATWRDEGVPLASSSDWSRRAAIGSGSAGPRTPPGTQHDLTDLEAALERACRAAVPELGRAGVDVDEATVRAIAEARLMGEPVRGRIAGRKSYRTHRADPPSAEDVGRRHGRTARQVGLVVRAVLRLLDEQPCARVHVARRVRVSEDRTAATGRKEAGMAAPHGYDLEGLKEIGNVIGRGDDQAARYIGRPEDPLPVTRFGGRIYARRADVLAWFAREAGRQAAAARKETAA